MDIDQVSGSVIEAAIRIHRKFGPGLFETAYERILELELQRRGFGVERQKTLDLEFEGIVIERAYCVDLLVEQKVIVEVKSIERLAPVYIKQLTTYLKLANVQVGLLINFGQPTLLEGVRRIVNRYVSPQSVPRDPCAKNPLSLFTGSAHPQ